MGKTKDKRSATDSEPKKSTKENKAPKSYSFASTNVQDCGERGEKIHIDTCLETAMLDLILKQNQMRWSAEGRRASHRLTTKKLTDLYTSLSRTGFKPNQIETAMTSTIQFGGDLIDALDWLCLNTPNDQLPSGFSQALHNEEHRIRPPFTGTQIYLASHEKAGEQRLGQEGDKRLKETVSSKGPGAPEQKQADVVSTKDWILKYTEAASDDDDDDEDNNQESNHFHEDTDPNERYLELTARLLDMRVQASEAKKILDRSKLKHFSQSFGQLVREMEELEKHPKFNPSVKISDIDDIKNLNISHDISGDQSKHTTAVAGHQSQHSVDVDQFDCSALNMFEKSATEEKTSSGAAMETPRAELKTKLERRSFAYTRQQWTGKSPKQFLNDWVAKRMPKTSLLSFEKIDMGGGLWRTRCKLTRSPKDSDLVVLPEIACENVRDAEHLASTLLLYHLCRGQSIHTLLPPPYRDVWLEWLSAEECAKKETIAADNKPRDQFIGRLMNKLKGDEPRSEFLVPDTSTSGSGSAVDSWEDWTSDHEGMNDLVVRKTQNVSRNITRSESNVCISDQIKECFLKNRQTDMYARLLRERVRLPVHEHKSAILDLSARHNVFIVAGETGSGKSTQVTQFLLEAMINAPDFASTAARRIICTEPRRISTITLAARVSSELGERNGPGSAGSLCGYQIRLESKICNTTRLVYCTTGVLLRQLQEDPMLKNVACVIVDEVHERGADTDFLLVNLRRLCTIRLDLKVVLMSATLDSKKFSAYFDFCPVIEVEGRSFPVEVYHLEDVIQRLGYVIDEDSPYVLRYDKIIAIEGAKIETTGQRGQISTQYVNWTKDDIKTVDFSSLDPERYNLKTRNAVTRLNPNRVNLDLIVDLIRYVNDAVEYRDMDGAMLIFVPGLSHIQELTEILHADRAIGGSGKYRIVGLHSILSSQDQSLAFDVPPHGMRKIVVATNVAETGITIADVVFVIDSGRVKEKRYLETTQMSQLREVFVSRASAEQRRGRAGRVRAGVCFRLYTAANYESFPRYSIPEILRIPLEELCLHVMKCKLGHPADFLSEALDAPSSHSISRAMYNLREIGGCDCQEATLTPLGHHLAMLPMDVRLAKMLIFAAMLGCLEPAAVIAASMTDKSPFVTSLDKKDASSVAKLRLAIENSDHLTSYNAFMGWKVASKEGVAAERIYCQANCLKRSSLIDIENVSRQLIETVQSAGFDNLSVVNLSKEWKKSRTLSSAFRCSPDSSISLGLSAVLKAVITAGFYPRVARTTYVAPVDSAANPQAPCACVATTPSGTFQIHPSSVNRMLAVNGWVVYREKVKYTSQIYLQDTSLTSAYSLLLFGGDINVQHQHQLATIDDWIVFKAPAKSFVLFKQMRSLIDQFLERKLANPRLSMADEPLLPVLLELIVSESYRK